MRRKVRNIEKPVEIGVRDIALRLLRGASRNCDRLKDPEDTEALHDFRVSVRRLISFLRVYRPCLQHQGYGKMLAEFKSLISATNAGRDSEVHAEWLRTQLARKRIPRLERQGLEAILEDVGERREEVEVAPRELVIKQFAKAHRRLRRYLGRPLETVRITSAGEVITLGDATADILEARSAVLHRHLEKLEALSQVKRAHRARLAAKALRYVLEPIRSQLPGAREASGKLKSLQEHLGGLRDLQTLEAVVVQHLKRDARDGMRALLDAALHEQDLSAVTRTRPEGVAARATAAALHRIRSEQRRLFRSLDQRWLSGHDASFFERIDQMVVALHGARPAEVQPDNAVESADGEPEGALRPEDAATLAAPDPSLRGEGQAGELVPQGSTEGNGRHP